MPAHSPYEILDLPKNATTRDIKRRYKDLVRTFNPEHHPERFMEIRAAYDMLLSTEMNAEDTFPIYKKPLEFLQQSSEEQGVTKINKHLLSTLFETPYDTEAALEKLFKQK